MIIIFDLLSSMARYTYLHTVKEHFKRNQEKRKNGEIFEIYGYLALQ